MTCIHLAGASSRGGQLSSRKSSPGSAALLKCRVRDFPNGDSYQGAWASGMPQGEGLYFWQDGSFYEGSWLVSALYRRNLSPMLSPMKLLTIISPL